MMVVEERTVREGYKMSKLGVIPVEWEVVILNEVGEIVTGSTPKTSISEYWDGDIMFVSPTDMNGEVLINETGRYVTELGASKSRKIPKGSVMVTCIASIGKMAIANYECVTNQQINSILTSEEYDNRYVYYFLKHNQERLQGMAGQTAVPIVNKTLFSNFLFIRPALVEQQKIAEILSAVDEQIENTEKLIKKTRELKKGLMQQLLTKGIGHTEFKMTELGEIPVEWEVFQLEDLFNLITRSIKMNDEEEYRLVTVRRRHGGIVERGRLLGKLIKVKSQYSIKAGDFLISKRQIVHGACEVVRKNLEGSIVSNEYHTLLANDKLYIEYFRWLSRTQLVMGYFLRASIGVHIEKMLFKLHDWYKYKVAIPPIKEQQKIAEILNSVEEQIKVYEQEKEKYNELKKGLMQQLLTGKLRVMV